jgi:PadR family transcriptional regulator, regulatory protein PadR
VGLGIDSISLNPDIAIKGAAHRRCGEEEACAGHNRYVTKDRLIGVQPSSICLTLLAGCRRSAPNFLISPFLAHELVLLHFDMRRRKISCRSARGKQMSEQTVDLPQGTLDLLILRTLALEPQHGWAISERIHQVSSKVLQARQGSLYPALHRLERAGWIKAHWGTSENNRRAKYYELTKSGRKQLAADQNEWRKLTAAVAQILAPS